MGVLPIVAGTPGWAGPRPNAVPTDPRTYARFLARVAARYGPGGTFWRAHPELPRRPVSHLELYNEPFLPAGHEPGPTPAAYARLVRTAVPIARRANPRVRFLIAGETTWTTDFDTYRPWMAALYAAVPDLGRYFDALSVHPYSSDPPAAYTPGDSRWQTPRIDEIKAKLAAHGDGDKHMWITEVGWTTCPSNPACASESEQASYVQQMFDMIRSDYSSSVDAVFLYGFHDLNPGDPSDKEQWFGFIRRDGSFKPAWQTLKRETGAA